MMRGFSTISMLIVLVLTALFFWIGWELAPDLPRWAMAILVGAAIQRFVVLIIKGLVADNT